MFALKFLSYEKQSTAKCIHNLFVLNFEWKKKYADFWGHGLYWRHTLAKYRSENIRFCYSVSYCHRWMVFLRFKNNFVCRTTNKILIVMVKISFFQKKKTKTNQWLMVIRFAQCSFSHVKIICVYNTFSRWYPIWNQNMVCQQIFFLFFFQNKHKSFHNVYTRCAFEFGKTI